MSTHVNIQGIPTSSDIRARVNVGRRIAKLIGAATIVSVIAFGAGVVQAGRIGAGGDWRFGGGLSCGPGSLSAPLPLVIADTAGYAWQFSDLYGHDGATWVHLARSPWRYTTLGPGESNQGKWLDQITTRSAGFDSFSVIPGSYYLVVQYVYVDGAWGSLQPLHRGYAGIGPLSFCFA